jgi:fatty aldehyde-generating acyl-ACP reductase
MNKFCFFIHPTSMEDVVRYEPGAVGKGEAIIRKILAWIPPYLAAHITGVRAPDGREIEGWFTAAPLLPDQMMELPREEVFERILKAIELAADKGAQIAGLGAFSGIVGDGGVTIAERSPIPVTTGNALTIATAVESFFRGAEAMGVDAAQSTAVVLGATGSIGSACLELLAPRVQHVILVAPNATRLAAFHERISDRLGCTSEWTTDVSAAVRRADLILSATSATKEIIEPEDLRIGAVVCDVSLPHTIGRRVLDVRPDVLIIEGGNLRMPGTPRWERVREPGQTFRLGLPEGSALACMSETMVLALEGRFESFTLGRGIQLERVKEIAAMAERCGFSLGEMRAFDRTITDEEIEQKRDAVARARVRS